MNVAKAYAPGNISCIFVIKRTKSAKTSGSLGLGFTIDKGVTVSVKKSNKSTIFFNNKRTKMPTVESVIRKLTKQNLAIDIKTELPISTGFGVSGAAALATAYAINHLLNLKKSKKDLARISHIAEVENLTGLGDVTNQYFGGMLVKYKSSAKFEVEKINLRSKKLYYRCFSQLDTKKVISNSHKKKKINVIGLQSIKKLKRSQTMKKIIQISKEFAEKSGLLQNKNVIRTIEQIESKKGNASMIMLGNAVFSDTKFQGSKPMKISTKGAFVIK